MIRYPEAVLPNDYVFVYQNDVDPEEIIKLRTKIGWDGDTASRWATCMKQSLAVVGVRDSNNILIGMGCFAGNVRHAILCDLIVDPDHQGKGIGKALLYERMRIAEELDVTYIYTDLSDTNPLREKYKELGFVSTGSGLFRDKNQTSR